MNSETKQRFETFLAAWLCQTRLEKGISQESLAVQLGKGQSDIAKMENGSKKITVTELICWMAALEIPFDVLCNGLRPYYGETLDRSPFWGTSDEP